MMLSCARQGICGSGGACAISICRNIRLAFTVLQITLMYIALALVLLGAPPQDINVYVHHLHSYVEGGLRVLN